VAGTGFAGTARGAAGPAGAAGMAGEAGGAAGQASGYTVAVRPTRGTRLLAPADAHERSIRRRVTLAWGMLFLNVVPYTAGASIIPLPSALGKAVTQGSLSLALLLALSLNRRLVVRRNLFLCLISILAMECVLTAIDAEYLKGTGYRTFRLIEFVAVLWLLTPYWGRRDMLLVRAHLKAMFVVLATVAIGYFVAHGYSMSTGRLTDVIWPAPATQVAHYAAVTIGLIVVLWFSKQWGGREALIICSAAGAILLLTRTRTALVALVAGLLIAGLSMIVTQARVRRTFAWVGAITTTGILAASRLITTYLERGESSTELSDLSGRTKFWGPLLAFPRDRFQEIFGFGLSNGSFNGLPIDSNWLASYQEQGLFGAAMCAAMLLTLLVTAYLRPRSVQRALALFLVTYCLLASFTEVGISDASPYLMDMAIAASLLVPVAADAIEPDEL
jgi:hypothetical protein